MSDRSRTVSFVVPTKNAGRTLRACLESLRDQDHGATEIVVVDNGSSDDTVEIARSLADIVVLQGPERSAQRNAGARRARGDVLVFVDADMVLEPGIARECADTLQRDRSLGALVLPELSFGTGFLARCRGLEKELYLGDDRVEAARAFRREAFEGAHGYDEEMNAFEDWDLPDRVRAGGWRIGRVASRIWHDDGTISMIRQFRKKRYYGEQSGRYLARHHTPRRRHLSRSRLLARPTKFVRRPHLTLGLAALKAAEFSGLAVGSRRAVRAAAPPQVVSVHAPTPGEPRILHVVAEFSMHEGIGRSIMELARHTPGEHHLLAARINSDADQFTSARQTGGSLAAFPVTRAARVHHAVDEVRPDVIHFHGGPLLGLWVPLRVFSAPKRVATMYAWPRVPRLRELQRVTVRAAVSSQVLRPRTVVTTVLSGSSIAALLRVGHVDTVLTADAGVADRLSPHGIDIQRVRSGAEPDARRAQLRPDRPIVIFAGRAETVRGIDTLLDALPLLLDSHPALVLRLLLLPRPETEAVIAEVERRGFGASVQVVTEASVDLRGEFARASVAAFPFKFDHVTIPPALTAAEAMSVGLPVVGTNVTCITAILRHDVNGAIVKVSDHRDLAAGIRALLDDPARWTRLSEGAVATIEANDVWRFGARVARDIYGPVPDRSAP